jgi:putative membrane protein
MFVVGLVLAGVAAIVHVFIFYLESIAWTSKRARATFGTSEQEAETTKLAGVQPGLLQLVPRDRSDRRDRACRSRSARVAGATLVFAGAGSMAAAALVLLISSPDKAGAALKQGVVPALAVIALAIGLAL